MAKSLRVGFIGVGNRGSQLLHGFMRNPDCEIAALCDVYKPYVTRKLEDVNKEYREMGRIPKMEEDLGEYYACTDFRDLLARKDVDAVCIATPDHWHAAQAVAAFRAGKDVFVEKPLTVTVQEGRRMVEVQQETGCLAGVGLNRRGSSVYRKCVKKVRSGCLGSVRAAYAARSNVMFPNGIGTQEDSEPPADLDWDMWLGPRPMRPYRYNISPYCFRWWDDYSSQMGNWGVHYLDVIRWMMNETAPVAVTAVGSATSVQDDRTIPDTMAVLFEMGNGSIVHFDVNEASGTLKVPNGEVMMCGSKGTLCVNQNGYTVKPTKPGQFQDWKPPVSAEHYSIKGDTEFGDLGIKEDSTQNLIDDFIKSARTRRQPICSLEEAHRSTTFAHLANISLKLKKRLEWDPETEKITNVPEANSLLHYQYRKPWNLD